MSGVSASGGTPLIPVGSGAPAVAAPAVEFNGVSKWFGSVVAVSDVTFSIGAGITSLLGPNGAGKSTVMRLLCGLTAPSSGTVKVFGRDPRADEGVFRSIGLVPQQESIIEPVTIHRFVTLAAQLSGVANPEKAATDAINMVELDPTDDRPLSMYSKGMRQRVKVASAIVHQPQLLILDEPLNGLDPRQRARMIELFHSLGTHGRSVIVTSHVLEEVERFGSRILLIAEGRLAAEGEFTEIRALMDDRPLRIRVRCGDPRALASSLVRSPSVANLSIEDDAIVIDTVDAPTFRREVFKSCSALKISLHEVVPLDDDLESVFRYLVSRRY